DGEGQVTQSLGEPAGVELREVGIAVAQERRALVAGEDVDLERLGHPGPVEVARGHQDLASPARRKVPLYFVGCLSTVEYEETVLIRHLAGAQRYPYSGHRAVGLGADVELKSLGELGQRGEDLPLLLGRHPPDQVIFAAVPVYVLDGDLGL